MKDVLEEVLQLLHTSFPDFDYDMAWKRALKTAFLYFFTLEQLLDWTGILIDMVGMCAALSVENGALWRTPLALWVGIRWLRALYGLRGYERIGPQMLPILSALQDTFIFILVVSFFLAAAVHAYYVLAVTDSPTPLYAAVSLMLRLSLMGDFDLHQLEGVDTSYVDEQSVWEPQDPSPTEMFGPIHVLFYIVATGITLTLMNLLIGILGSNYDRFEDQNIPIFLRARAKILVRYAARPWARNPWSWPCQNQKSHVKRDGYLWVATRAELNLDDTRSMRTIFREELRKQLQISQNAGR